MELKCCGNKFDCPECKTPEVDMCYVCRNCVNCGEKHHDHQTSCIFCFDCNKFHPVYTFLKCFDNQYNHWWKSSCIYGRIDVPQKI